MALKKPNQERVQSTTTPAFEQEPTAAAAPAVAAVVETAAPEADATAKVQATTAIAKAQTTAVSTADAASVAKQFKKEVEAMKGAADFGYGSHRVVKADNGALKEMAGEKVNFGRWMKVRLLAWDYSYQVSPGEQGKDSGQFVAYSKDGVTIDSIIGEELKSWEGKPLDDYLEYLRNEEEFDKAGKREFIDTECAVLGSEDEPEFREVLQVTLSSSSIPAFRKYQSDLEANAKCVAMGLAGFRLPEDPFTFYYLRDVASKGSNTWTKLKIVSSLPAKI